MHLIGGGFLVRPALGTVLCLVLSTSAFAAPLVVTPRGSMTLATPSAVDQNGQSFTITGMSGVVHRGGTRFASVMDNSNRVVLIDVALNANASIASVSVAGGLTLAQSRDHEGICIGPACDGSYLASDETTGSPAVPALHEYDWDTGALLRTIDAPTVFQNARANFGFESLTRSPSGGIIWTANEEALTSDGPQSTQTTGTIVRLQQWRVQGQEISPFRQFAYVTQPMHAGMTSGARSGLVDLVALPDGRLLAMERSLAATFPPFQSRIYEVDFSNATDVSGVPGLIGQTYTPVTKTLLWSGTANNLEGLCLGPKLANGSWALVGIVDDADPLSNNTVVAFELAGVGAVVEDVNADGHVRSDDAYAWAANPSDVNHDGVIDEMDRRAVADAVRVVEACDVISPDR